MSTLKALLSSPAAAVGMLVVSVFALAALLAPWLPLPDPLDQDLAARLLPPAWLPDGSPAHWLGTDHVGRDILSRLVWSSRTIVPLALGAATISLGYGAVLGLVAAYRGGRLSDVIMRVADTQHAFPFMVIAIAVVAAVGPSLLTLLATLSLWGWVYYARVAKAEGQSVMKAEYVQAAVSLGARPLSVVARHVLPNAFPPLIVIWTFTFAEVVLLESGLSFLGLGVPPPAPSWGSMLSEGRAYIGTAWWLTVFPGLAIMLMVLAVNMAGDTLQRLLDPRQARRGA